MRFVVRFFAVIGVLAVIVVGGLAWGLYSLVDGVSGRDRPQADRMVLRVDVRTGIEDVAPADPLLRRFGGADSTLWETVAAIDAAAEDGRVEALFIELGGDTLSMATAQELHAAVTRFRDSGKPTVAYAASFGEGGSSNAAYLLATAFDEIVTLPIGLVSTIGFKAEVPLAAQALDDLGIDPLFARRGAYKSFPETFTERTLTAPHREMLDAIVSDLTAQLTARVAADRGIDSAVMRRLIDRSPLTAPAALEVGLIDRIANRTEVIRELAGGVPGDAGAVLVAPADYPHAAASGTGAGGDTARIALIHATGSIVQGESAPFPGFGSPVMGADTVTSHLDRATLDDSIAAIVLRIDSGGGSAVASDLIGAAVARATSAGKPVVVSMGSAAASGGYWIAAPATEVVAQGATLTGSIGVFAGKFETSDLWADLGVRWDIVQEGLQAEMWSSHAPFDPEAQARLDAFLDRIYLAFLEHVAAARALQVEQVRSVAEGRVWTGAQALERGLVDRVGGYREAEAAARAALGLAADAPSRLVIYPEARSVWSGIDEFGGMIRLAGALLSGAALEQAVDAALDRTLGPAGPAVRDGALPGLLSVPVDRFPGAATR